ncbi:MAG: glycosyltransferase [Pseudomonadota bacterium]|nr:glycosyltransferase [Pseudomonadota bacterium]
MWASAHQPSVFLKALNWSVKQGGFDGVYASKVLADFYLFEGARDKAVNAINYLIEHQTSAEELFDLNELFLLQFSTCLLNDDITKAFSLLTNKRWLENSSKLLAMEMLSADSNRLVSLNRLFKVNGLSQVTLHNGSSPLDSLCASRPKTKLIASAFSLLKPTIVSVVVPCYNAEKTIATCLKSLKSQTWPNLEIIAVDDGSTDNSLIELTRLKAEIGGLKVVSNKSNHGAYATRNLGISLAKGDFLTVMDADDWAHPQKIEKQVIPLLFNRGLKGTVSHWVRCTEDLKFSRLRAGNSWVHRNVSSLLVRKDVVATLGGWDEVKVNADTEFYERCLAKFGQTAIKEVMPDIPLSFGRTHSSSLTQNTETHLVTQYGGVRKQYMDFARAWHNNSSNLKLSRESDLRMFPVPSNMLLASSKPSVLKENTARFHKWTRALDENWYTQIYDDVRSMGLDLHDHFWGKGEKEGRYPSSLFNPQAYTYKFELPNTVSPTWHALNNDSWDFSAPVSIKGFTKCKGGLHVALFGHAVSETVFGAERSLVDMAKAMSQSDIKVTLFLPSCANTSYIEELREVVNKIVFLPLPWAKGRRKPTEAITQYLVSDFLRFGYDCVYVNTLTLIEPFSAAKQADIPSIMHVRELVEFDDDLASLLQESPQFTHERVISSSDYFIANSAETANWLSEPERTAVIHNCVDTPITRASLPSGSLKICMLSSNVKKKGVDDFFEVASLCKGVGNIQFTIYGPITNDVTMAIKRFGDANVNVAGYVEKPKEAMIEHHIVLALSHFKESFGRTVAEAMSLGRVVVGYDWGAVNELVNKQSGILVDYKSTEKIVDAILDMNCNPELVASMGSFAAKRAKELFSRDTFSKKLVNQIVKISKKSGKI